MNKKYDYNKFKRNRKAALVGAFWFIREKTHAIGQTAVEFRIRVQKRSQSIIEKEMGDGERES
ncbi:hypothetical protein SDC9_150748 [bioreactor metagenome]|uniref:Uncharacterized protein n=1 Tax=bioreactor metagenome TaxID=1076179 RepID=A0A645ENC4_9ZZZZ